MTDPDRDRLIKYLRTAALISIEISECDIPVEGSFATDDAAADAAQVTEIKRRLRNGDTWAWCTVTVSATCHGYSGSDSLGACSYADEQDFRTPGWYFDDMVTEAIAALATEILDHHGRTSEILDAARKESPS